MSGESPRGDFSGSRSFLVLLLLALVCTRESPVAAGIGPRAGPESGLALAQVNTAAAGRVRLVQNVGQWDPRVRFQLQGTGGLVSVTEEGLWLTLLEPPPQSTARPDPARKPSARDSLALPSLPLPTRGVHLKVSLAGTNPQARLEPLTRQTTHVSYFVGNDPARWRADVPVWSGVRYREVYPGIDWEVGAGQGGLSFKLVTHAGADLKQVRLRVQGADALRVQGGRVQAATPVGDVALPLFQVEGVAAVPATRPSLSQDQVLAPFGAPPAPQRPRDNPSELEYSTYIGGSWYESGLALAVDRQGAAYVAGYTYSWDFPTTPGAFQLTPGACEHDPCYDAYVAKVNPRGTGLEYAAYIGGKSVEWARGITVGRKGEAYVTGMTASPDFPTTAELYGPQGRGAEDVFVVKLNATGTGLEYATRLGGSRTDMGVAIALGWWCRGWREECPQGQDSDVRLEPEERAFLTGLTWSTDFPVTAGAMQGRCAPGCQDAFVVQLDGRGRQLVYATYLGGGGWESGLAIAVNGKGEAYIGGQSESGDLPGTAGGADSTYNGGNDGFILKLNAAGTAAVYATYLGGSGYDLISGLALDSGDQVYVTGITESRDLVTTAGAFQPRFGGGVAFKSVDGGANWRPTDRGLGNVRIRSFSIDPFTPTHVYAGDGQQILFRSKDGGENWAGANWNNFLPTPVFDPQNPGVLYVGGSGFFKSVDGGETWGPNLLAYGQGAQTISLDPTNTNIIYGADTYFLYKSIDGGETWVEKNYGLAPFVESLVIDPLHPRILYAATHNNGVYKTTDGAETWSRTSLEYVEYPSLALDPQEPNTLYAVTEKVVKTTDGGATWRLMDRGLEDWVTALALDPLHPRTLYAATYNGVYKTTDGGENWRRAGLGANLRSVAVDPRNPVNLYAGGFMYSDAFAAKLDASGAKWAYVTYLGRGGLEEGRGIGIDRRGNAIVAGWMESNEFPTTPQGYARTYRGNVDAFVLKLNERGTGLVYSTFLGGTGGEAAFALAVDEEGAAYVTGQTYSLDFPISPGAYDPYPHGIYDLEIFVSKLRLGEGKTFRQWLPFVGYGL